MQYQLTPIHCRPWLVAYLSIKLVESHYENDYGGALRRLNAITEQLRSLDPATTPGHVKQAASRSATSVSDARKIAKLATWNTSGLPLAIGLSASK